jgi:hypothetical protein
VKDPGQGRACEALSKCSRLCAPSLRKTGVAAAFVGRFSMPDEVQLGGLQGVGPIISGDLRPQLVRDILPDRP